MSDEELVKRYQKKKDTYYLGLLFERYSEMTSMLCLSYLKNKHDAEDAVMDCFEIISKDILTAEIQNFGGWYYSVVKNHALKLKRRRTKGQTNELLEGIHDKQLDDSDIELFDKEDLDSNAVLKGVLSELKPLQKKCVELFYIQKLSYTEIAEEENLTVKEVKSHIQNGKRKLKINLEKQNINSVDELL